MVSLGARSINRLAIAPEDAHLVVVGVEADVGSGDVVEDDHVETLALQFAARPLEPLQPVLRGEADQELAAVVRRHLAEDVGGGLQADGDSSLPLPILPPVGPSATR